MALLGLVAALQLLPGTGRAEEGHPLTGAQIRKALVGKAWNVGNGEAGADWHLVLESGGEALAFTASGCERAPFAIWRDQLCSNPGYCFVVEEYPQSLPGAYVLWPDGDPMATPLVLTEAAKPRDCTN